MKILHIYKDYFPVLGGIENHIKILAEAQAAAGDDVTVLVCDPGHRTQTAVQSGVKIIKAGRITTAASMPLSLSQPLLLAQQSPDIVHIQSPYPLGEVTNWLLGHGQATIISHQSDIVRQKRWLWLYSPILRRVLEKADRILASSPRYIETSPWLRSVREKCSVVPLGVDPERFTPNYHTRPGTFNLLFVGRLRYYKGLDTLIEALIDVPDTHLTVVGDGPMREQWLALSNSLGLQKRITFVGDVPDADLPDVYRSADAFVLPANARAEAFGQVLLEAMASGLPCITTELGTGTSWIVQDGVTGLVVPARNPYKLAQAILHLREDPACRISMSTQARARIEAEFTIAQMIERIQAVYESVLSA
jgi:rhamnosyl/mannosyltransferase